MITVGKSWKYIFGILVCYLVFVLIGALLPYLIPKQISEEAKAQFANMSYQGEEIGPD